MKKIIELIFSVLLILGILFVYFNIDKITNYTMKFFTQNKEIIIPEDNDYKRNYKYERFENENNYRPLNKDELENIYFNILNNGWDTFTFYCPDEYASCLDDIRNISTDEVLISKINNYVSPFNSFSYLDTSINEYGEITLVIHKSYSEEEISKIDNEITKIINNLNLSNLNNEEKLEKIKYYLIENTSYDNDFVDGDKTNSSTKATGALFNKKAVCSGYSDTMALFLDKLNIPNLKISSENHIWNLIFIDNEWKHIDITWSDTDSDIDLKNKYFLISTKELQNLDAKEHNFDKLFYLEAN